MDRPQGCLKNGCLGCLGLVVLLIVVGGVSTLIAWRGLGDQDVGEERLTSAQEATAEDAAGAGTLVLDLRHGEFEIFPAAPGTGVRVEATYDRSMFELVEDFDPAGDDGWLYKVGFRRTIPGLQAAIAALIGGGTQATVHVFVPTDVPVALHARVEEGGCVADLGGLWLTDADLRFSKGGFDLRVSEPLREPLPRFAIKGRMGGFSASRLGNASPAVLTVDCAMGGADVDLRGAWANDCDADFKIRMGGMAVGVPREVNALGLPDAAKTGLREPDGEIPVPELRFRWEASMGEVEFQRR